MLVRNLFTCGNVLEASLPFPRKGEFITVILSSVFFSNKHVIISEIFIISDYIWSSAACEVICELNCSYFVFINVNLNLILIEKSF